MQQEIPSALVELGFITHKLESKLLASNSYQKRISWAIFDAIQDSYNSYINSSLNDFLSIDGITGLNTFIGQSGEITTTVKFENRETLALIEKKVDETLNTLKATMLFQSRTFFSVCSYQYEKEGITTEL